MGRERTGERAKALTLCLAAALLLASCGGERQESAPKEYAIDRTFTRGPVDFRVAVSRDEITIAERLDLLVETRTRKGYDSSLPSFGEKLDQFGIVDYVTPPERLEKDGSVVSSRLYTLEPFLSGDYRIPPMTVEFREDGDSTSVYTVESDTLEVRVLSILPEDMEELELKDIAAPETIPASRRWIWIAAGAAAAAAAGALVYLRIRRGRKQEAVVVTAHEKAFASLEALLAEALLDEKRYAEFTARVSDILRVYIEDRFGLKAPERTTEEFLAEAEPGLNVDQGQKRMLRDFLTHCDLVKFAAFEPTEDDVRRTFESCRDFIESTKREEVSPEAA